MFRKRIQYSHWEQNKWPDLGCYCQGGAEQRAVTAAMVQVDKFTFCSWRLWALFLWWPWCYRSRIWTVSSRKGLCADCFAGRCSQGSCAQQVADAGCYGTNPALCKEGGSLRKAALRGTWTIAEAGKWDMTCFFSSMCSLGNLSSISFMPVIIMQFGRKTQLLAHFVCWKN